MKLITFIKYQAVQFQKIKFQRTQPLLNKTISTPGQLQRELTYIVEPLTEQQINRITSAIPYLNPTSALLLLKQQIKYKQLFAHEAITEVLLKCPLQPNQQIRTLLYNAKLNLSDQLWIKCLNVDITSIESHYLCELLWALKDKEFIDPKMQELKKKIETEALEQIAYEIKDFSYLSLSLLMQTLKTKDNPLWKDILVRYNEVVDGRDIDSLKYSLNALAIKKVDITTLNQDKITQSVLSAVNRYSQMDLMLVLWSINELKMGNSSFWKTVYVFIRSYQIKDIAMAALISQIVSKQQQLDANEWINLEHSIMQVLAPDEKSLVTLYHTFSVHRQGSQQFWNSMRTLITQNMHQFTQQSLVSIALHTNDRDFVKQLPLQFTKLKHSQLSRLFNLYGKLGIDNTLIYNELISKQSYAKPRDIVLILYTLHLYCPQLDKNAVYKSVQCNINKFNEIDRKQLMKLQLPEQIRVQLQQQQNIV